MTKILVVEDNPDIRELLIDSLCDIGYAVMEAGDGGAGLQSALEGLPDIILLDMMMPVLDGLEVLDRLKSNPLTRFIPVIMVSARGQEQDISTALNSGALTYLVKPWEPEDLEAKVRQAEAAIRETA
ncbi:MAG: response regulator [Chloroflexi bacterium]|nr:response regulator [Chloroflexota bacterium]